MIRPLTLALGASLLAGCAERLDAPLSPTFGQAVASMDAQIVPATPGDAPPEGSAARGVAAIRRYEKGQPRPLEPASTSTQGGAYASAPQDAPK
ncbi:hypothetical protein [Phenylobacterium sp.]|uniref:hypothetical protein n=1 Tax=Phenylobacterium sp. TaxID=1871053 RepID=UPI002DECD729|nr:hypothetical protein [Phenylobacterium sp.]